MNKVFWLEAAKAQRNMAIEFIARDNLENALEQLEEISRQTERLTRFQHLGRPDNKKGIRNLTINRTSFVITYRIVGDNIQILRFRHTSQKS